MPGLFGPELPEERPAFIVPQLACTTSTASEPTEIKAVDEEFLIKIGGNKQKTLEGRTIYTFEKWRASRANGGYPMMLELHKPKDKNRKPIWNLLVNGMDMWQNPTQSEVLAIVSALRIGTSK